MNKGPFLIPSLIVAGFGPHDPAQGALTYVTTTGSDDPHAGTLMRTFTQGHKITLAQHRSHRSHSSHSSHRSGGGGHSSHMSHTSHRSSTSGYDPIYTPPAESTPAPSPPPPPPPPSAPSRQAPVSPLLQRATPPEGDGLPALSGRSKKFAAIVRRVQLALLAQGYYQGGIDGIVGPAMRSALRRFQQSRSLQGTGTITPETLDALMISSE